MTMSCVVLMLATGVASLRAESPIAHQISQDPLTRQIQRQALRSDGVQAVTWVKSSDGKSVSVALVALDSSLSGAQPRPEAMKDALNGLRAAPGLKARKAARPASGKTRLNKARPQLEFVEKKSPSWGR